MKTLDARSPCPCGRLATAKAGPVRAYADCCGRWLEADTSPMPSAPSASSASTTPAGPPDAETLMRSRYSAFVLEREAYLLASWAQDFRPETIAFEPGVKWLGLDVRSQHLTGADRVEVEFVARQKPVQGPAVRLHESSRFVRVDGRWLYLDGDAL